MLRRAIDLALGRATPGSADDADRPAPGSPAETETLRRIVARLEAMPPEEARYLAGFAYVLSRAANADLEVSDAETRAIERFVAEHGGLDPAQAVLVVELARLQARHHGATEDYLVTREFKARSTPEQRRAVVECCLAIAAVDGAIGSEESATINQIASELDVDRETLRRLRADYARFFSALRGPAAGRAD